MKWPAPVVLSLAVLAVPGYLLLDQFRFIPPALCDRPWPFALWAVVLALGALRLAPRLRIASLVVALAAPAALAWQAHARYRLPPSSPSAGVGAPLPDLALHDEAGRPVHLRQLDGRPTLLVWFRGAWCPYCRRQLSELSAELRRFSSTDLQIVAVAPDPPAPLAALKRELALPFSLLSDPERQLVNRCELGHCGAVLDAGGVIRWAVISGNWEKDLPARALLQAAYRMH